MIMSFLHCGHCIFVGAPTRFRDVGASRSATQSNRQLSCATKAQGHGDRQTEDSGVSSVSSAKHIQHFLGSSSGGRVWPWEDRGAAVSGKAEVEVEDGMSRITVWESSERSDVGGLCGSAFRCAKSSEVDVDESCR